MPRPQMTAEATSEWPHTFATINKALRVMNPQPTRREAIRSIGAGALATAAMPGSPPMTTPDAPQTVRQLPQARRDPDGTLHVSFRVIAADDFQPVPHVAVEFHWWGTDGGIRSYVTDEHGIITFTERLSPNDPYFQRQLYWLIFLPQKTSRFANGQGTLMIQPDGTYYPDHFMLPFYQTDLIGMKIHAERRPEAK